MLLTQHVTKTTISGLVDVFILKASRALRIAIGQILFKNAIISILGNFYLFDNTFIKTLMWAILELRNSSPWTHGDLIMGQFLWEDEAKVHFK